MPMCADAAMRLDRLLTTLAVGSRSQVKTMLRAGRVTVNGQVVRSADAHVQPGDRLTLDQQPLDARTTRHVLLNKPCGVLTAARDSKQPTVLDLLPPAYRACGCMPVGRLDKDTSGLLLLTTDGELAHRLLSPKRHVWKCYEATVDGPLNAQDTAAFAAGLELSDFTALPAELEILLIPAGGRCSGTGAGGQVSPGAAHVRRPRTHGHSAAPSVAGAAYAGRIAAARRIPRINRPGAD